jgi:phage FluMu protein Com
MKTCDASHCAVCGNLSADRPRLFVEQDRHYDCPQEHGVGLCKEHGEALRTGRLTPQEILYDWVRRHHDEIYDGTRIYLMPRMTCLGCNATFASSEQNYNCPDCGTVNVLGTALGHPTAVRVAAS